MARENSGEEAYEINERERYLLKIILYILAEELAPLDPWTSSEATLEAAVECQIGRLYERLDELTKVI